MEGNDSKRRRSDVWSLFTQVQTGFARCDLCDHKLSYKSSITNLRKHVQRKHPNVDFGKDASFYLHQVKSDEVENGDEEEESSPIGNISAISPHSGILKRSRVEVAKFLQRVSKHSTASCEDLSADGIKSVPVGSNLQERALNVLESELWADCKFIVGDEKEEIRACKIILSIASPVFAAMFFGELQEIEAVEVPYVEPDVFRKLLEFIYTHQVEITSSEEAFKIVDVAHEYMMPDLVQSCTPFLKKRLNTNNMKDLCNTLDIATLYNIDQLKDLAIKEVQEKTKALLESDEFLELSPQSLVSILQRGHLNVESELNLINAAVRWATARCMDNGEPIEGKSPRAVLKDANVLKHLRFLLLTERELQSGPIDAGILTEQEIIALKDHLRSEGDLPPPESLCTISRPRKQKLSHQGTSSRIRTEKNFVAVHNNESKTEMFQNNNQHSFVLLSVTLATQEGDEMSRCLHPDGYEEDLDVLVVRPMELKQSSSTSATNEIYATGSYVGKVKYRGELTIPVTLEVNGSGPLISMGQKFGICVTFHKSGTYAVYYNNASENIKCVDIKGHVIQLNYRTRIK